MVLLDGIYRSDPIQWRDDHGGAHFEGISYQFWRFFMDGTWLSYTSEDPHMVFWTVSERHRMGQPDPQGLKFGAYTEARSVLTATETSPFRFEPKTFVYEWEIQGLRLRPIRKKFHWQHELIFKHHG